MRCIGRWIEWSAPAWALALVIIAGCGSDAPHPCDEAAERAIALEVAGVPEEMRAQHAAALDEAVGRRLRAACHESPGIARCLEGAADSAAATACLTGEKAGI